MPAKILIVDDELFIIKILGRQLEYRGYEVRSAQSAEAALALLERESVDAVLLDNILPGMTGMKALAGIRSRTAAPVFLMTGHFDEEFRKDAMLLGAADVLAKPMDVEAVCAALAKTTGRH
jgi:DNA-binding response OmpR family regulator